MLMPIVFLFSAIVSGIGMVLIIYMVAALVRKKELDMACLDKLATFLFIMMIVDFSLEALDFVHRVYQSEESIKILSQLISERLFVSLIVIQLLLGMIVPLIGIALVKIFKFPLRAEKALLLFVRPTRPVGDFHYTMERSYGRTTILQELPRFNRLQDQSGRFRRTPRINRPSRAPFCHTLRSGQTLPSLGRTYTHR